MYAPENFLFFVNVTNFTRNYGWYFNVCDLFNPLKLRKNLPWIYCRRMQSFFIPLWYLCCWFSIEVLKIPRWDNNSMNFWKNVVSLRKVMRRNLCRNSRRLICTKFYGKWQHDVKGKYFWGKSFYATVARTLSIKSEANTKARLNFEEAINVQTYVVHHLCWNSI